jgi:hypothetical protein
MPVKTVGPPLPTRVPVVYHESLTNLYGSIWGVFSSGVFSYVTILRYVDWLSPQLSAACTSGRRLAAVNLHTPSGKTLTLGDHTPSCEIASDWPAGLPPAGPGVFPSVGSVPPNMEAILFGGRGPVLVNGVPYLFNSYNWTSLNVV